VAGAVERKVPGEKAEKIFELMAHFAGYGFNKSHSAAYALVSFQTAYLKVHHPREFMAATMTSEMGDSDRLLILTDECRRMGIRVLPPDVNASEARFAVTGAGIPFGLAAVKNVGMGSVEAMLRARHEGGAFSSLFDFTARVESHALNRRVLESLVAAGAFDSLAPAGLPAGAHRAALFANVTVALEYGQGVERDRERGQGSLFDEDPSGGAGFGMAEPRLVPADAWSRRDTLAREKDALGFYLSGHPMEGYEAALRRFGPVPLAELRERGEEESLTVAGLVVTARRILNKKGAEMAFVTIEDRTGTTEAIVFADVFARYSSMLEEGTPVLVMGRLSAREDEEPKLIAREFRRLNDTALAEEAAFEDPESSNGGGTANGGPAAGGGASDGGPSGLHLSVDRDAAGSLLPPLIELLRRHSGDLPLFLHLVNGSEVIDVQSGNIGVRHSPELIRELAGLLGAGRARFESPSAP